MILLGCFILILIGFFIGNYYANKDNENFYQKYIQIEEKSNKQIQSLIDEKIKLQARLQALEKNYPLALEYKKEQSKRKEYIEKSYKKTFRGWGMRLQMLLEEEHITHSKALEIFNLKNEKILKEYIRGDLPNIQHLVSFIEYFKPDLNWFIMGDK